MNIVETRHITLLLIWTVDVLTSTHNSWKCMLIVS